MHVSAPAVAYLIITINRSTVFASDRHGCGADGLGIWSSLISFPNRTVVEDLDPALMQRPPQTDVSERLHEEWRNRAYGVHQYTVALCLAGRSVPRVSAPDAHGGVYER